MNFRAILGEFGIVVNGLEILRIIFQVRKDKELSPREGLGVLSF